MHIASLIGNLVKWHHMKADSSGAERAQPTEKARRILRVMHSVIIEKPDHTYHMLQ
jgi:hypothetical protein